MLRSYGMLDHAVYSHKAMGLAITKQVEFSFWETDL